MEEIFVFLTEYTEFLEKMEVTQKAIDNIRYYNKKSQDFARSELIKAGSDAGTVDPSSGVYHPDYGGRKNMFSKKI